MVMQCQCLILFEDRFGSNSAVTTCPRLVASTPDAGALKKRLGLRVVSEKEERGRVYRISEGTAKRAA